MCGRYYIDSETAKEIEALVKEIDGRQKLSRWQKDIHPSDEAPVLAQDKGQIALKWQHWGFPGFQGPGLIFNARSETALQKKMFCDSLLHRRAVMPCTWFYEWNKNKERVTFCREDEPVIFLAGFYRSFGEEERFVILTTEANQSMVSTHDRMPLILEREEVSRWILDDTRFREQLAQRNIVLRTSQEYKQIHMNL